jgi:Holliday junction resolvase RusA-like endonuclease
VTNELRFTIDIPCQPKQRTAHSVNNGRVRRYTPEETRSFEAIVSQLAWAAMRGAGLKIAQSVPVHLIIEFIFPVPKSASAKVKMSRINTYHINRPDLTNLCKSIEDGCNGVVYKDDSQIASMSLTKTWGEVCQATVLFQWTSV